MSETAVRNSEAEGRGFRAAARFLAAVVLFGVTAAGAAEPALPVVESPGEGSIHQCQYGMVVRAIGGGFRNVLGTMTVPASWPGQQRVRVLKEELPPGATVSFKTIEDTGRQMLIHVPSLAAGEEARAVVTFEVELLRAASTAQDPATFSIPDADAAGRKLARFLSPSPRIESDYPEVAEIAREATAGRTSAWAKVQAIHEWVFTNIQYESNEGKRQGVPETLRTRAGDCDEKNSLAVAMCRACRIPARLVRIPRHCCYEFYLIDGEGSGQWIFADASARPAILANQSVPGVILQKGDNFTVVDPKTKRHVKERFLADGLIGLPLDRGAQLQLQLISPATGGSYNRR